MKSNLPPIPEEKESKGVNKQEKFREIAKKRTLKAINAIRLVGNCASPAYEYTEDQVNKIVTALSDAVVEMESRFSKSGPSPPSFSL